MHPHTHAPTQRAIITMDGVVRENDSMGYN